MKPVLIAALSLIGLLGARGPAAADDTVAEFRNSIAPLCQVRPAPQCVDRTWEVVDLNGDGQLSFVEIETVHDELSRWLKANGEELRPRERSNVSLGLALVNMVGLKRLYSSYDADDNGLISREELLADIDLDQRPLPEIVQDSDAVKWQQIAQRLGAAKPLLDALKKQ